VGTSFPYVEFYPKPGKARGVQIDNDGERIGLRYPVECGLVGDAAATLRALVPRLQRRTDDAFLKSIQKGIAAWRKDLDEQGALRDTPMKPQVVAFELNKHLTDQTIVTTDSGTNTSWAARYLDIRGDMKFSVSGNLASMACGLPYANAAALAYPDRPVVALVGDGGLSMLMAELSTSAKYDLNVKIIVLKNNSLGQIKWEQMAFLGNPEYGCDLQPIDYSVVAQACGVRGYSIVDPNQCQDVLAEAFAEQGPALIEATVDPNEPPLPPKVSVAQTRHMIEALVRGTPDGAKIAKQLAKDTIRQLI
jgi:pyruvate dehydrogenase (quinone)/pyruvate oxidase